MYSLSRYQSFLRTLPLSPPLMLYFGCSWIPRPTWKKPLVVFLNSIFHLKALAAVLNESQSKKKKSSPHFMYDFSRENLSCYILLTEQISFGSSILWLPLLSEIMGNMYIVITCFLYDEIVNFEINLRFLNKLFSCMTKKGRNKKHFSSILKDIHLSEIVSDLGC